MRHAVGYSPYPNFRKSVSQSVLFRVLNIDITNIMLKKLLLKPVYSFNLVKRKR